MTQLHPQRFIPWVFFIFGLLLLALTTWPLPVEHSQWIAESLSDPQVAYTFTLEWPQSLRVGEEGVAGLTALRDATGEPPAQSMLEARLEFAGLVIDPNGSIAQTAGGNSDMPLEYRWLITAHQPGKVSGTLWIYLVTQDAGGIEMRDALVARALDLEVSSIFGLPVLSLRWMGGVLIVISMVVIIRQAHRWKNGVR